MRVARVGFTRVAFAAGAMLGLATLGGAPAAAASERQAPATQAAAIQQQGPAVKHAFKVTIYPAYTTAGLQTTFEVTVANTSSQGTTLRSVQVTPPAGFTVAHPSPTSPLRRKTSVKKRTFSLHQILLKPGHKMQFNVTATAPTACGNGTVLRWTSRAFQGMTPSGPQLALQVATSSVGVTVVCPQLAPCGDGGPACSTSVNTSVSTYGVVSNAAAGTLRGTLDVGRRLTCGSYRFRDPNWYDSVVTPPVGTTAPPAGTPPIVDQVSYTIVNAGTQGLGFCLGALYDFATASGAMARGGTLPNGNAGFIGLLPMCTPATPPCISSISQQTDSNAKSGYDAVMSIQIPEQGDPWGAG
jgi:hypothetical protein